MARQRRREHRWAQIGQSMAEYTVVMAALVGGLLVANRGACPDEYEDCIEYLLTVMHDNYDGYSASISAVHEYATDYEISETNSGWDDSDGGGDDDGSSDGGGGDDTDSADDLVTEVSAATAVVTDGDTLGVVDPVTGEVVSDGEVVGTYDSDTGIFTPSDGGGSSAVDTEDVVVDSEGNVLERQAVTDCDTGEVHGFGYRSEADGEFYNSLTYGEMDVTGYCVDPAFKATVDGEPDDGRIVNGYYYGLAISNEVYDAPMVPQGEVIYFEEYDACVVMAVGWDAAFDPDDGDYYDDVIDLWTNSDPDENPQFGELDEEYYVEQVMENGVDPVENDCPSNRVIAP